MNVQMRLLIFKSKYIYDDLRICKEFVCKNNDYLLKRTESEDSPVNNIISKPKELIFLQLNEKGFNAYLISIYIDTLIRSKFYRKSALNVLTNFIKIKMARINLFNSVIAIKLRTPKYQFLDYAWNERITRMVMERQEIDHAMSWLSTLGGAFSALGDQFDRCVRAKVAGKISVEQFKLSMRLGDPQLVARCKLYAALSLLQQGHFQVCKYMIKDIYKFAISDKDVRLQRMCQGVWAKLKYCKSQRTRGIIKNNLSTNRNG